MAQIERLVSEDDLERAVEPPGESIDQGERIWVGRNVRIASTAQLAAPGTAARRGGYVSIFCTGLGAVTNQPGTGDAAPGAPYSLTRTTPTVKIGGVAAVLQYSGLAPGFVGLYQVNAQVPMSVSPGNAVPVIISVENSTSNTVTIAVQ